MTRLEFERTRKGMSQGRLARLARFHQPLISQIERGRLLPTQAEAQRLAEALGLDVQPEELLAQVVSVLVAPR